MIYFFELISKKAISGKDIDALIEHFQANNDVHVVAALLEYKESHQKQSRKNTGKSLELSDSELGTADWRKLFKFKYTDSEVEIIGCMIQEDAIDVPKMIGKKPVQIIGRHAFDGHNLPDKDSFETELPQKRKIIIPEGVTEINAGAFFCINNRDIYIPESVRKLPSGMLLAVEHIIVHLPNTNIEIPDDLAWDSPDGSYEICKE